jgi:hypothetical protein
VRSHIALVFVSAALAACSSASLVNPAKLDAVSPTLRLRLDAPFKYKLSNLAGTRELVIAAGTYRAVGQDNAGVYYLGPPGCFANVPQDDSKKLETPVMVQDCGIYVPKSEAEGARPFLVTGTVKDPRRQPSLQQGAPARPDTTPVAPTYNPPGKGGTVRVVPSAPAAVGTGIGVGIAVAIADATLAAPGLYGEGTAMPASSELRGALRREQ